MDKLAVIDFETTGLSPRMGDRATEVAVVLLENGRIVDRYQSLMNAGIAIPANITALTGISNAMIRKAPPVTEVMKELVKVVSDFPLAAHNAAFDRMFLDAEWQRISRKRNQEFICSMLLARRLYPLAPNHKLGTLVDYLGLPSSGRHHRALADAEMTAHLLLKMASDLKQKYFLNRVPHEILRTLQKTPKGQISRCAEQAKRRLGL